MEQAYRIIDTISLIEEKERQYAKNKIDTSEALALLEEAKVSFKEERYDEAEAYLKEADLELDKASSEYKRVKGLIRLSKNFFQRYWWQIIVGIIILAIITPLIVKRIRRKLARRKLEALNLELQTLNKLIKKAQEDCFRDKKITENTYKIRVEGYKSRITEIKYTIPVLEAIISREKMKVKKEPEKRKGVLEVKR